MNLKLNKKRTFYIGLAFFTILMMWQTYNSYCPLILKNLMLTNFGPSGNNGAGYDYIIGLIMAVDNVFALIMLPLFGNLSDKTHTKLGKRMPYIIVGTLITVALFPFIPFLYLKNSIFGVAIMMGLVLISMNMYRNPAVSLMPDVTPKPLRSKANAIINFVGYIGAIFASIIALFFASSSKLIVVPFIITSIFMLIALIILVVNIRENKIASEMSGELDLGEKLSESIQEIKEDKPLCKQDVINSWLIIISVFLWFFAFNAVETFWTTYCEFYLHISSWSLATMVLSVSSLIAFLPCSYITEKMGRKNVVVLGLILMIGAIGVCAILGEVMPKVAGQIPWQFFLMIAMFGVAGIGWAFVNVNSYPMVVEMSNKKNIGKFTGYYYTSSMLAQSITPAIIGWIMGILGYKMFFLYAILFLVFSSIVFCFVKTKNGCSKKIIQ